MTKLIGREGALECHILTPEWEDRLLSFLEDLAASGDERFFRPHGFDNETVSALARQQGKDLYYILADGATVLGYGMLRGWDEGFPIPSLGVAIHPSARGRGLGKALMHFLHAAAAWRGADKIRLRVSVENDKAIALYESLGYDFADEGFGLLVGFLTLGRS